MNLSIRTGLLIAAVALSVGLVTAFFGGVMMERLMSKELMERGSYIAQSFAEAKLQQVVNGDVIAVRDAMAQLVAQTEDVEYLYIVGFDGRLFAHSFQGGFPQQLLDFSSPQLNASGEPTFVPFQSKQGRITDVSQPLIAGMAARLHVGINHRNAAAHIQTIRWTLFVVSLLIAVIGLLVGTYFMRKVTRPLGVLAGCMRDYGEGRSVDPTKNIAATTTEVRELADSFARMISEREGVNRELRTSQSMLRMVLDAIPVRVFWKDRASRYIGCNANFAKDAGLQSSKEIVGKDDFQLSWREQAELYRSDDREVMETGEAKLNYEQPQSWLDGTQLWLETSKVPLRGEDGEIAGVMGVYTDITERKSAQQALLRSRAQLEAIFNSISDAAVFADTERRIVAINPAVTRLFGYTFDELAGRSTEVLYASPQDYEHQGQQRFNVLSQGETEVYEQLYKRRDSTTFVGETLGGKVVDVQGEVLGFIGVVRDVTERKQAEQQLAKYRERLEELVDLRTKELTAVNKELESFSYSVSHDLRAPLRGIDGFSHALLEDYADSLDDTGRDYLERIRRATQRMGDLIDDLLALSKVSRRELSVDEVRLSDIAQQVCQRLHESQPKRKVQFDIEKDLTATCDAGLIRIVLENLLENAWKYTGKTDNPHIEFGATESSGEGTVFFVRDNGVGFDMQYADRLFGAFQRVHRAGEFEGTGVGLATVQRIVHRHGGRIWAEAEVDRGATFFFTLAEQVNAHLSKTLVKEGDLMTADSPRASES